MENKMKMMSTDRKNFKIKKININFNEMEIPEDIENETFFDAMEPQLDEDSGYSESICTTTNETEYGQFQLVDDYQEDTYIFKDEFYSISNSNTMEVTIEDCQKKREDNIGKDLQQTKERLQEEKQKNEEFKKNVNLLEGYMEKFRKQLDEMENA